LKTAEAVFCFDKVCSEWYAYIEKSIINLEEIMGGGPEPFEHYTLEALSSIVEFRYHRRDGELTVQLHSGVELEIAGKGMDEPFGVFPSTVIEPIISLVTGFTGRKYAYVDRQDFVYA
jgi:hypothetical protein